MEAGRKKKHPSPNLIDEMLSGPQSQNDQRHENDSRSKPRGEKRSKNKINSEDQTKENSQNRHQSQNVPQDGIQSQNESQNDNQRTTLASNNNKGPRGGGKGVVHPGGGFGYTPSTSAVIITQPGSEGNTVFRKYPDRTGAILFSCVVTWFCCCILGVVAFILARKSSL